jgi:hypothetical protein
MKNTKLTKMIYNPKRHRGYAFTHAILVALGVVLCITIVGFPVGILLLVAARQMSLEREQWKEVNSAE